MRPGFPCWSREDREASLRPSSFLFCPSHPPGNYDNLFIEAADYDDGFAKIVHGFQPVSDNLLLEESDGFHPTKEVGIRLGWDDEQILIWYMRQLMEDQNIGPGKRIDSPMGVVRLQDRCEEKQGAARVGIVERGKQQGSAGGKRTISHRGL